ncbi:MAG: phosphotransferase [Porticoccaceae bacterium]
MAVYTTPDPEELAALCRHLGLGAPGTLAPVAAGVENSTWFLTLPAAPNAVRWVLTIVENREFSELLYPAALCVALHDAGLPVPPPRADGAGHLVHRLAGKPALLVPLAPGEHLPTPLPEHCAAIGDFLGRMHALRLALPAPRANPFGRTWLERTAAALAPDCGAANNALLARQLDHYRRLEAADALPRGPIHADLFRDNALFSAGRLSAVIDFHSACHDWLLLDVAIALHDWAGTAGDALDTSRASALLHAYAGQRPFTRDERRAWPDVLGLAAARFWASRALALLAPADEVTGRTPKDPEEYRARLLACEGVRSNPPLPVAHGGTS